MKEKTMTDKIMWYLKHVKQPATAKEVAEYYKMTYIVRKNGKYTNSINPLSTAFSRMVIHQRLKRRRIKNKKFELEYYISEVEINE
jgi:hypothetical protein